MPRRTPARWLAEYAVVRAAAVAAHILGPTPAHRLGRITGWVLHALARRDRRRALENLRKAESLTTHEAAARQIARGAFLHLASGALEAMAVAAAPRYLDSDRYVRFERLDRLQHAWARGRGVILALAHLGNWEVAGLAAARRGLPIVSIARPMKNPLLERFLAISRQATGQKILPKRGSVAAMLRVLRANGLLALLCDQRWRHGIVVDFFGRPAATVPTPAMLALRCGAPIVPVEVYRARTPPLHRVICHEPLDPEQFRDRREAVREMSQELTRRLEEFIRRHPEQWLWMHNRWRTWKPHRRSWTGI